MYLSIEDVGCVVMKKNNKIDYYINIVVTIKTIYEVKWYNSGSVQSPE